MGNFISQHVLIPKFTISDVAGVTFGGFLADKYVCSQPNATPSEGSPDVAPAGAAAAVPAISKAGVPVWDYITFPQAMIACCNRGKGWHLLSAFEYAALAFLAKKYGTQPHGGNANVDPPSDITFTTEIASLAGPGLAMDPPDDGHERISLRSGESGCQLYRLSLWSGDHLWIRRRDPHPVARRRRHQLAESMDGG